jgi:cytochrome c oxidase cbb3-type subunit III
MISSSIVKSRMATKICCSAALTLGMAQVMGWSMQQRSAAHSDGRQVFAGSCASCHGLDGRGSGRAPNLVASQKVQKSSDAALLRLIQNGIPSGGMPGFRNVLGSSALRAIVSYLHVLQGKQAAQSIPGDAQKGRLVFFGKGRCAQCHTVAGEGGFIAPDLSDYARFKTPDEIRSAILEPGKNRDRQKSAAVTTQDNQSYTGIVRNEDNFSLQLQTLDGAFHLFIKSDLKNVEYQPDSLMPANYGSVLSKSELDDLVNFLVQAAHAGVSTDKHGKSGRPRNPRMMQKQAKN